MRRGDQHHAANRQQCFGGAMVAGDRGGHQRKAGSAERQWQPVPMAQRARTDGEQADDEGRNQRWIAGLSSTPPPSPSTPIRNSPATQCTMHSPLMSTPNRSNRPRSIAGEESGRSVMAVAICNSIT